MGLLPFPGSAYNRTGPGLPSRRVQDHMPCYSRRLRGLWKQDMKTFLCEVVIVGQDFRQPFAAQHLHGDAIGEAVFLVGARLVQGQPLKK